MRIGIVGAGPAGVFAAITAASRKTTAEIEVLEATHEPLDKVLLSGGGRCNVTHHCYEPALLVEHYPRGRKELRGAFERFQPRDTVAWFNKRGVQLKVEDDGRIFPVTDSSATIVDCLLEGATERGVKIRLGAGAIEVTAGGDKAPQFDIKLRGETRTSYDRLLLATGSSNKGYRLAENLGHSVVPCVPSLFTFKITDPRFADLSGLSFENVKLTLTTADGNTLKETGPLLITHWGLSGPAVLKLSAWGARLLHDNRYRADLNINLLPGSSTEHLYRQLLAYREENPRKHVSTGSPFAIPKRYWSRIAEIAGASAETRWTNITRETMKAIIAELTASRFTITGKGEFKEEFVTCGGVSLREVDFRTMESKLCPGLYFAGEILDIDGITGGFNFQSAWTTGWIAGSSIVT